MTARYVPKNYKEAVRDDTLSAIAYVGQTAGAVYGIGYSGKRNKPDWHHRFRKPEDCAAHISKWLAGIRQSKALKADRMAKRKEAGRGLEVGNVLRHSWGYDQTNIDYYEVTALIGSTMVEIREIGCESFDTAWMQGESAPLKGSYTSKPPMRRVAKDGAVKIFEWGSWAHKMTPDQHGLYRSSHWTAYA
jgi:hypothetical protein